MLDTTNRLPSVVSQLHVCVMYPPPHVYPPPSCLHVCDITATCMCHICDMYPPAHMHPPPSCLHDITAHPNKITILHIHTQRHARARANTHTHTHTLSHTHAYIHTPIHSNNEGFPRLRKDPSMPNHLTLVRSRACMYTPPRVHVYSSSFNAESPNAFVR